MRKTEPNVKVYILEFSDHVRNILKKKGFNVDHVIFSDDLSNKLELQPSGIRSSYNKVNKATN